MSIRYGSDRLAVTRLRDSKLTSSLHFVRGLEEAEHIEKYDTLTLIKVIQNSSGENIEN